MALEPEFVAVGQLKPHPRNYRSHPDAQLEHIAESIRQHGFYRNVVVARDYTILAGHGVVLAAKRVGLESVPVVRLDIDPASRKALKVLAGDNEVGRLAQVDDRELVGILKQLRAEPEGLLGTGFDDASLKEFVLTVLTTSEVGTDDDAARLIGSEASGMSDRPRLIINFETEEDRAQFANEWTLPPGEKDDRVWTASL